MRILQISDTHISAEHAHFADNLAAVLAWLQGQHADLIISTGDVSMNGAVGDADYASAIAWQKLLEADVMSVPGNHDVGDVIDLRADQVLDDERLGRFRRHIGPDRWTKDIPGWRLIGINAMLCSTGYAEETQQEEWLAEALATPEKVALFMHKPLFIDHADEGERGYWSIKPAARKRILNLLAKADVRLVASGHLHIYREKRVGDTLHLWCPSAAFICGALQEELGGERLIGVIEHDFTPNGHSCRLVQPAGTRPLLIDPVVATLYPPPQEVAAE